MQDLPKIHVGITRTINLGNYEKAEVVINLSNIPATANEALIDMMLEGPAAYAFSRLKEDLERKGYELMAQYARPDCSEPERDPGAFHAPLPKSEEYDPYQGQAIDQETAQAVGIAVVEQSQEPAQEPTPERIEEARRLVEPPCPHCKGTGFEDYERDPFQDCTVCGGKKTAPALETVPVPVPDEEEVAPAYLHPFGVRIQAPASQWYEEPITEIGADGGAGQLVAVNAALAGAGYADKQGEKIRHRAATAILEAAGVPLQIGSIKDLSKAHAHVILSFFERATPAAIIQLGREVYL